MRVVIKGSQDFVNITYCLVTDVLHHVVVILKSKGVIELDYVASEPFPKIDHYVIESSLLVFHDDLGLGQVNIEVIERGLQLFNLIEQLSLVVVELD